MALHTCNVARNPGGRLCCSFVLAAAVGVGAACQVDGRGADSKRHPQTIEIAMAASASDTDPPPPLTRQQEQDIQWLRSILSNPASEPDIRSGAAVRLLGMDLPQAIEVVDEALRSGEAPLQLAVVEAMQSADAPVPELLDAAIAALRTASAPLLEPLALALARHNDAALEPVAALASDRGAPVAHRLGPIHALGVFRSRAAAVELMALLDPQREEPEPIISAVCSALHRVTGLPYGEDADQWRRWWADARDQPREEWMSKMVQRLSEQLAAAEHQIQRERDIARRTEFRLAEAYRDLFAALTFEDQLAALPPLLEDPLVSVRAFALDRVSRLLRDSVRIGEELQRTIAARLDDEVPALRMHAARLLDQLNHDDTTGRIAGRLEVETSTEVVAALLELLAKRPSHAALPAVLPWLDHATLGGRAANVLWEVYATEGGLDDEVRVAASGVIRPHAAGSSAHARLLAAIGDATDATELEPLLESDSETMRRRVAEGFFRRNLRQPLLDRAHDPVIYPLAVRALAAGPHDLASFRALALLTPSEQSYQLWADGLEKIAAGLSPSRLIEADDLLATIELADDQLRARLLRRAVDLSPEVISGDDRDMLGLRLARLLLDLHRPLEAHELLESLNGELAAAGALQMRFEAAALAGEFDIAADLVDEPRQWVTLLSRAATVNPTAAASLHEEITRRFDGDLDTDTAGELEAVAERLRDRERLSNSPA